MSSGESKSWRTLSGESTFGRNDRNSIFPSDHFPYAKIIIVILGGHLRKLACITGVSLLRLSGKEMAQVKERGGGGEERKVLPSPPPPPTFFFWLLFHFSRGQNRESRSSVFLCSKTKRKRLLRRLWKVRI